MPKKSATQENDEAHVIRNEDIKGYAKRLETMLDEDDRYKLDAKAEKSDLFREAEANGITVKILKDAVKRKRKLENVDTAHEELVCAYLQALGVSV